MRYIFMYFCPHLKKIQKAVFRVLQRSQYHKKEDSMKIKSLVLAAVSVISLSAGAFAAPYIPYNSTDCSECNPCREGFTYGKDSPFPSCVQDCFRLYDEWGVRFDTLYWKATEGGLDLGKEVSFSRHSQDSSDIFSEVEGHSKVKSPDFQYDVGFRLNISHDLPNRCAFMFFEWTNYGTTADVKGHSNLGSSSSDDDSYTAFQPYWETLAQNFPDEIKGKWRLNLNMYDLCVARRFCISSCFSVVPFFGLRVADVDQKFDVRSHAHHEGSLNGASYHYKSKVKARCDFVGVGPRLGFLADYKLGCGFSLFGQAAGSLVYGKLDRSSRERFENRDHYYYKFEEFKNHAHGKGNDWCSRAITDLAIGLKWDNCIELCNWKFPCLLALSWEHHGFFDFNNFNFENDGFTNTSHESFEFGPTANLREGHKKHGDLFTQGLTFSIRVGF